MCRMALGRSRARQGQWTEANRIGPGLGVSRCKLVFLNNIHRREMTVRAGALQRAARVRSLVGIANESDQVT